MPGAGSVGFPGPQPQGGGGGSSVPQYVATLTQSSTDAPVATELVNTLGTTITWGYTSTGIYTATAGAAVFTANKTVIDVGPLAASIATRLNGSEVTRTSTTVVTLRTKFQDGTQGNSNVVNAILLETRFTIEVYP